MPTAAHDDPVAPPDFGERRQGEVRRITLPRTPVNKARRAGKSLPSFNPLAFMTHGVVCVTGRRPQSGWYSSMSGVLVSGQRDLRRWASGDRAALTTGDLRGPAPGVRVGQGWEPFADPGPEQALIALVLAAQASRPGLDVEAPEGVLVAPAAFPVLPVPLAHEVVVPTRVLHGEYRVPGNRPAVPDHAL